MLNFKRYFLKCGAMVLTLALCSGQSLAAEKYLAAGSCDWPPMEFLNDQKQPQGYAADYLQTIAKMANIEIEFVNVAWDGILGGVATGKYDIVASSVTITDERKKQFDFSEPYYEVVQAIIVPAGKSLKSLEDLKGKKVGGQIATTGIFVVRNANVGAELKEYDDVGLAIQDLIEGRIDAVACDDPVAMYYVNKRKDYAGKLNISFKAEKAKEYYGFVVKKGRTDLLNKLNAAIRKIKTEGLDVKIAEKWMGK